jgi:hypothetical protein
MDCSLKICAMMLEDLDYWVKHKAKPGDMAYHYDHTLEQYYFYAYKGPDEKPFWRACSKGVAEAYLEEVSKERKKIEETKMSKTCDNCKYFKNMPGSFSWCSHKDHAGALVQAFTSCADHELKQKIEAPFDNLKFFIKDQKTGELEIKYICEDSCKIMQAPFHWQFRVPFGANKDPEKRPGYYYWCEECWEKEKKK